MKLRRLRIERLAGIDHPFEFEELGDGLNIIIGPNGIGKSRVCTTVRALLWHERGIVNEGLTARADFEHQDARWQVTRDGSLHRWQREGIHANSPTLPGERLDGCFFLGLRDLLDDSDHAGRDLASEIRKQMAGGFDLDAVEQRFASAVTKQVGRKEEKAVRNAEQEIRKAEQVQADLESRERGLESLEAGEREAQRASQRLAAFTTAISLQALRADHARKKSELDELPEVLANLDGKESSRLDTLIENLEDKRSERETADDALAESREVARGTRLDGVVDPAVLETWRERADKLVELEGRLEAARVALAETREAARVRRRPLAADGPSDEEFGPNPDRALTLEDDFDLFVFLGESHQLASKREAVTERLGILAGSEPSEEEIQRLEQLKRGVEPLRRWLRTPDPENPGNTEGRVSSWKRLIMAGTALAAIGLAIRFFLPLVPDPLVVVGVGIGLAVAGLSLRLRASARTRAMDSTDWRSIAEKQFPESLEPPNGWSPDTVEERLEQLEDELAQYDAKIKRARDRGVERKQLEANLTSLNRRFGDLEERRRILMARLGLTSIRPDVEIVDLARALDASRAADVEVGRAAAKLKELEEHHSRLIKGIATPLAELGEREPVDGASARAGVHSLEGRDRALRAAMSDEERERKRCERLACEIERLEAERAEIFRIAGIDSMDRGELMRLLEHLGRYHELKVEISNLASGIERLRTDLDAVGEAELAECNRVRLQEEQATLKAQSEDRMKLHEQIVEIKLEARDARKGHVLEEAIAKKDVAMRALRDRRDEALASLAGQILVDDVRREHETNQMPRVLERARDRFATFTHHRYELRVSPEEGGSFVAMDTKSGEGLSLDELSDGTRAQLILAARLAFAEEAEQGADLPLFLDEAMDHSDPKRFHAIAGSLARMVAEDGRQIFYLTNDPTDIERFQLAFNEAGCGEPKILDLAEIRGQQARVDTPDALRILPLPGVPHPGDQDPESYGVAIGVPALDPGRDPAGQHLYYVLRDDLLLLHAFLEARIESVGQCRNAFKGGSAIAKSIALRSDVGAGLEARFDLLEIFCFAWREGRGLPAGRLEIEASEAVSEKYLDVVVEMAFELDGNARRILDALRDRKDSRLSGFRTKSTDELERYFVEHGQLDDNPILEESEIIQRAIGTPASNRLSPKVAVGLVHQWWELSHQTKIGKG